MAKTSAQKGDLGVVIVVLTLHKVPKTFHFVLSTRKVSLSQIAKHVKKTWSNLFIVPVYKKNWIFIKLEFVTKAEQCI